MMLKFPITLIAILICCMAFMSCNQTQDLLEKAMMIPEPEMTGMEGGEPGSEGGEPGSEGGEPGSEGENSTVME